MPSAGAKLWFFLHQVGAFPSLGWPSPVVYTQYPLIPWMGVMALGWLLGTLGPQGVRGHDPGRRMRRVNRRPAPGRDVRAEGDSTIMARSQTCCGS